MKSVHEFLPMLFHYGFWVAACVLGLVLLVWMGGLVLAPVQWLLTYLFETRCPQCRGLFKRNLLNWEVVGEREVLKTVDVIDEGMLYSNSLFEPNHVIEIKRQQQITAKEEIIRHHWICKDGLCAHQWETEETSE